MDWPRVAGVVRASGVERTEATGTKRRGSLWATVRYEYVVDGQTYEGDRVAYGDYGSILRSHAEDIVARYPVGAAVTVSYMPNSPEESLLEPGIRLQSFLIPLFGAALLALGITGLVAAPKALAQLDPPAGAPAVRVVDRRRF